MITTLETVKLEDLPIDPDGDFIVIIDPRDQKLKQLYIDQMGLWTKGFEAAIDLDTRIHKRSTKKHEEKQNEQK